MTINYRVKQVYGNDLKYVTDEKQALAIAKVTGKKTIDERIINGLTDLGLEFNQTI